LALGLLRPWQRVKLALLIGEKVALGLCDLLLAGAMYLLFLQLQGGSPSHHSAWMPQTALAAAYWTITLVVIRLLLDLSTSRSATRFTQGIYSEFLQRLIRGYGALQWNKFVQRNRSELLKHAMGTALDAAYSYQIYLEVVAGVIVVFVMGVALVYQSPGVTFGLAGIIFLLFLLHRYVLKRQLQVAAKDRELSIRSLQRILTEVFSASKEIRAYGNQDFFYDRLQRQSAALGSSNIKLALLPQFSRVLAEQGVVLLFLGIILVVLTSGGDIQKILSLLLFYFVVSRRLLPIISQIALLNSQIEGASENLLITAQEFRDCETHRTVIPQDHPLTEGHVLQLEDVRYVFDNGSVVLDGISMDLRTGETVMLRGVSGSGKSSLLNLIAGVSQPSSGIVRMDRSRVAYVPQEIALLDDSIRNNLLFGLASKTDGELMQALSVANLATFVAELPQGLETRVGDSGVLLSGGQRQRLGLARAVLRQVTLLLLDEATSALDEENERQILAKLSASSMAVLLVTHRQDRGQIADRVLLLQDGKLVNPATLESSFESLASRS
jgi:ABC-type bacteriocin/lantibiotic exporter with double-glycine peptidase domain